MNDRTSTRGVTVALAALTAGVLFGMALIAPAQAQEAPIDVSVRVNPPAATVGDLVRIVVSAEHDADVIVTAIPPQVAGADQLAAAQPITETLPSGREVTTTEFVIQPFTLEPIDPGTITVEWLREDSTSGAVEVDVPAVQVIPVRAPNDTELRPLKPQLDVPGAPPAWVRPAAIAAIAVASLASMLLVAWLAWRRWRNRPLPPAPEVTAEDRAREALDRLTGHRLVSEEDFQFYYGALALIIRRYLEERFEFNATALTTTQLDERMTGAGVERWQARLVGGLLSRSDAAIYARRYPNPDSADHDLTMAYEIVELSRGREPLEPAEAPA